MIRLELKDYCHDCVGFEPEVEAPVALYYGDNKEIVCTDTIVRCKHAKRCAHILKYVMEGYKENASRNTES